MDGLSGALYGVVVLLLMSAFIKIFTAINIARYGFGLGGAGFGVVSGALALALSSLVMVPVLGDSGIFALFNANPNDRTALETKFRPFLTKNAHPDLIERFAKFVAKPQAEKGETTKGEVVAATQPLPVLVAAFVVSELREAVQLGVALLIPFIIIDLLVVHLLAALGVHTLSALVVSLPLKLLLFISVDGWALLSEKLLSGYF